MKIPSLRFWYSLILLGSAAALLTSPDWGESFDARHVRELAGNPADIRFRLEITGGPRSFRMGERIPITLLFSSTSADKYKLDGQSLVDCDREIGEEFVLEVQGVADPYRDLFIVPVEMPGGSIRGGTPILELKPYEVHLTLNHWFRFDRPGRYRLFSKSQRLTRARAVGEVSDDRPYDDGTVQFAAVSNVVEVEIVEADRAWNQAKLREILSVLDREVQENAEVRRQPDPNYQQRAMEYEVALQDLTCLGTPDAVALSLEHSKKAGIGANTRLLVGARDRLRTIAALDRYMADPQVALTRWDFRTRALFTFLLRDAPKLSPFAPGQFPAPSESDAAFAAMRPQWDRFEKILSEEATRLIPVVAAKEGEARARSTKELGIVAPAVAIAAGLIPAANFGLSRAQLIAGFLKFGGERQVDLLGNKWDLVRGSEMIPILQQLVSRDESPSEPMAYIVARDALLRLLELAPRQGTQAIKDDIASGAPRFVDIDVNELPAQEMPEADAALVHMLQNYVPGSVWLVAKFGTVRIESQVRKRYLERSWDCGTEEQFLAYFLRTMPQPVAGCGIDLVRRAMATRKSRGCYRSPLSAIARVVWNPAVESLAMETLEDPEADTARIAAEVLAQFGPPTGEALLWSRLERWAAIWRGHAKELEVDPITGAKPSRGADLGHHLSWAIASAKSWRLDEPRRKRLVALCVDDSGRKRWSRSRPSGPISISASNVGGLNPESFLIEDYTARTKDQLRNKLQQFPAGTVFLWCPASYGMPPERSDALFSELSGLLSQHSMRIESGATKTGCN